MQSLISLQPTHNRSLLMEWVNSQLDHLSTINPNIIKNNSNSSANICELFSIGFIDLIFESIDKKFFSQVIIQHQETVSLDQKKKCILKYGQALNQYLMANFSKKFTSQFQKSYFDPQLFFPINQYIREQSQDLSINCANYSVKSKQNMSDDTKLQKINEEYGQITTDQTIQDISEEVQEKFGKIVQNIENSIIEILKMQFYIILQSTNKNLNPKDGAQKQKKSSFIERVCSLSVAVQNYLMNEITIIENQKIESITDLKQLLNTIQLLEEQNQQYKDKIGAILEQNQTLQQQIEETVQLQEKMSKQIYNYGIEKKQLFQQMGGITTLQEFVQIYRHIESQNYELEQNIEELDERNYELQTSNAQIIHSINKNAKQITKTNEDIVKFKNQLKGVNDNIQLYEDFSQEVSKKIDLEQLGYQQEKNLLKTVLRQNNDIFNRNSIESINGNSFKGSKHHKLFSTDNILGSNKLRKSSKSPYLVKRNNQEEDSIQMQEIDQQKQKYRKNLMNKLENLYKQISELTNSITTIKEQNLVYEKRNQVNSKKLKNLKLIHEAFYRELEYEQ